MPHTASVYFIIASGLCAAHALDKCHNTDPPPTFTEFVDMNARTYLLGSDEYARRNALFDRRVAEVREQNCRGHSLWWSEVNKLSDWTEEELAKLRGYKGHRRPSEPTATGRGSMATELMKSSAEPLPKEMDWKYLAAMVAVQDQGGCGSCWAFAAATVLRAHSELYQKDHQFSVQQIVSCTPNKKECGGTGGCNGATAELAMTYVMENGCVSEDEFPYEAGNGGDTNCPKQMRPRSVSGSSFMESQKTSKAARLGMIGWAQLPPNKMEALRRALVELGPVAVTVASSYSWNQYAGGIMDNCPKAAAVDHAVALIGYGEHDTRRRTKYWVLQNSWGTSWGEAGFIRMIRTDDDETTQCGWDTQPELGSGCNDGPPRVWVCGMCGILYDTVVPHFAGDGKQGKAMALKRREVVLLKSNRTLFMPGASSPDE